MNPTILAQVQFAVTSIYHFFFVPLTLGLSVLVAILETIYVRSGNEMYKRMALFWGKLFLINFAMGVVTGIVMEFQFGMNWSNYARMVGDIFGAPLAIEALLAFFLESVFLGVWLFGRDRLPKWALAFSIWMVAIGANISAFWILAANSFMQAPVGYAMEGGRAVMTNFWAVIGNPYLWLQFPHTVLSGFTTGAFFMMGISAYHLIRKREPEFFGASFRLANVYGVVSIFLVILVGHSQAQRMVQVQPMKMAAAEALWESEDPASFSLFTWGDEENMRDVFAIRIPNALSLLAYNRLEGEVKGINDLQAEYEAQYGPGDYSPSIFTAYWTFRIMVGAGFLMLAIAGLLFLQILRKTPFEKIRWFHLLPFAIPLPYIANTTGWMLTEMGRQPWAVVGVLKTVDAITPTNTGGMVLTTLIGFGLVYGVLMFADLYLLRKHAKAGPQPENPRIVNESVEEAI